ncbi:MAG: SpoIVB peptidase [Epulopiscium sp.]|nr:SpoIVB peptidase [Candidatus Epulonipiscium sp.]
MYRKKNKKRRKFLWPAIGILGISALWCGIQWALPNEINMMQGKEHHFALSFPFKAQIIEENIGVLSVNNEPVQENIHRELEQSFTVKAENTGNAEVSLSLFGIVPVKTVNAYVFPEMEVIPSGKAVGVSMDTDGIMVLGTGYVSGKDNTIQEPAKGILKSGDLILKANGKELQNKEDLIQVVEEEGGKEIHFSINRKGETKEVAVKPVFSLPDNNYKIGVWVRDSTQGIGTLTYIDMDSLKFGALGHGVYDIDTKELMKIRNGKITKSSVNEIKKGEKGVPGELMGNVTDGDYLGEITQNSEVGLYGNIDETQKRYFEGKKVPIALKQEIHEGKASILSNIQGTKIEEYEIEIESVNHFSHNVSKGLVLRITDERLLSQTGGIVQGMSGSPILQDGKLIGAVTHVFVQNPEKGYGIFIENMIKQQNSAA